MMTVSYGNGDEAPSLEEFPEAFGGYFSVGHDDYTWMPATSLQV
jgi:hypothetical protein